MTENPPNPPASDSDYMPMVAACTKVESQRKSPRYRIKANCNFKINLNFNKAGHMNVTCEALRSINFSLHLSTGFPV